jgi:hypothetical protein
VREITGWPAIINLRADPYEKMMFEAEMGYLRWYADNMWIFVPIQGVIKEFLATIPDYPFQAGSSLNAAGHQLRSSFVAPQDRVATFDMDGTVLLEKPAYALFSFAIPLIKAAATAKPALLERPHVKAIVEGDMKYFATAGKFGPEGLYATLAGNPQRQNRSPVRRRCQRIFV